ncbi:MAG: hypothetical protein ACD_78C00366G0005 [uncultured bacterium (gcode 4)]|uniref:Large ribosomal subunit protein uL29 n=1 Tax=uncultured bacterium (gcode 4) TaxID=1234023 RepID=K1YAZ2_9BACT|nr:MAG: hypothetical protein ACD_78C00366G0005 [uncultured bacterium (gcode 4)]MDP2103383.1 50S ribosomal protein L29 [Candidatus Gracilibacteria bacterium]
MKKQVTTFKTPVELSALDAEGLAKELNKSERELFLLTMKHRANELKQTHTIRLYRKYIAGLHMIGANS